MKTSQLKVVGRILLPQNEWSFEKLILEHFQGIPMRLRGFPSGRRPASGFHAQPEEWPHGLAHTAMTQHSVKML